MCQHSDNESIYLHKAVFFFILPAVVSVKVITSFLGSSQIHIKYWMTATLTKY